MKTINSISKALVNLGLLVVGGLGNTALAHTQDGSLPAKAEVADYYQVTCQADTLTLEAQIKNISPSSPLLTLVIKNNGQSVSSTDPVNGDGSYSPMVSLAGGVGQYSISVVKAGSGVAAYSFEFHCKNGATHTGTDIVMVANDAVISGASIPTTNANNQALLNSIRGEGLEGSALYADIVTADGCHLPGSTKVIPVVAQSVLFPTDHPTVTRADTAAPIALDAVIGNAGLANLPQLIQNKSVFLKQSEKTDVSGNVIGFVNAKGQLNTHLDGATPFIMGGVRFVAGSCARSLQIKLAIADICKTGVFPPSPGTANLWIPKTTEVFNDPTVDGVGYPPSMVIRRDLEANPFTDINCGEGFDVIVEPSSIDIDTNLRIPKFWAK